jgi:hypothetical protein
MKGNVYTTRDPAGKIVLDAAEVTLGDDVSIRLARGELGTRATDDSAWRIFGFQPCGFSIRGKSAAMTDGLPRNRFLKLVASAFALMPECFASAC